MPDVHLDAVEAGLDRDPGGAPVVLGDALDAGGVDGAQTRAHRGEAAGRGERGSPVGARVGHGAGVTDLCGGRRALGVHGVGEAAEPVEVVPGEQQAVAVGPAFGRDGQVGHGRHGDATGRHAAVELDEGVAHRAARASPPRRWPP